MSVIKPNASVLSFFMDVVLTLSIWSVSSFAGNWVILHLALVPIYWSYVKQVMAAFWPLKLAWRESSSPFNQQLALTGQLPKGARHCLIAVSRTSNMSCSFDQSARLIESTGYRDKSFCFVVNFNKWEKHNYTAREVKNCEASTFVSFMYNISDSIFL